jgi:hypothetical protein
MILSNFVFRWPFSRRGKGACAIFAGLAALAQIVSAAVAPGSAFAQGQPVIFDRVRIQDAPPAPNHVRFVYAIPADGVDRQLDTKGILQPVIDDMQNWFAEKSDGYRVRVKSINGRPEVLFWQLKVRQQTPDARLKPRSELHRAMEIFRDQLEDELSAMGLARPDELYMLFYDGRIFGACGFSFSWAATRQMTMRKSITLKNLQGVTPANDPTADFMCQRPLSLGETRRLYAAIHVGVLHELFHAFGAVLDCALDRTDGGGHVVENRDDLMYSGPLWRPSEIDRLRRNYFRHGRSDCHDVAASPFVVKPE